MCLEGEDMRSYCISCSKEFLCSFKHAFKLKSFPKKKTETEILLAIHKSFCKIYYFPVIGFFQLMAVENPKPLIPERSHFLR